MGQYYRIANLDKRETASSLSVESPGLGRDAIDR